MAAALTHARSPRVELPRLSESNRRTALAFAGLFACLGGCASSVGAGIDDPRAASAERGCATAAPLPTFRLVPGGPDRDAANDLVVSADGDSANVKAFLRFARPGARTVMGGELVPSVPPREAETGRTYFVASVPDLPGGTYTALLQGMARTNLAPECQESFAVSLGTLTRP